MPQLKHSFTFNGIRKDWLTAGSTGRNKSFFAPLKRNLLSVPGRPGALYNKNNAVEDVLVIEQEITVVASDNLDAQNKQDELVNWLYTDEAGALEFDDEPGRTYYALLDGDCTLTRAGRFYQGSISFVCPDPYKYGPERSLPIQTEGTVIQNKGTAETRPVFSLEVTKPSTMIEIATEEDYMAIGRPLSVEDTPYQRSKRLIQDEAQSLVGWGSSILVPDGGARQGSMQVVGGEEFEAKDYGNGLAWHGPVIQQALSETCEDWFVRCYFNVRNNKAAQRGRAEMYLLSAANEIIGKISVACNDDTGRAKVEANLRNSQRRVFFCNKLLPFRDGFYGYLNMRKEGNKFFAEFGLDRRVKGKYEIWHKESFSFTDLNNEFQTTLAAVALHTGTYRTDLVPWRARIRSAVVNKYNLQDTGVPYIVEPGDEVAIDHIREEILVNGEVRTDLKDFGGNYFPLKRGENILTFNPPDSITGTVNWRERYR